MPGTQREEEGNVFTSSSFSVITTSIFRKLKFHFFSKISSGEIDRELVHFSNHQHLHPQLKMALIKLLTGPLYKLFSICHPTHSPAPRDRHRSPDPPWPAASLEVAMFFFFSSSESIQLPPPLSAAKRVGGGSSAHSGTKKERTGGGGGEALLLLT